MHTQSVIPQLGPNLPYYDVWPKTFESVLAFERENANNKLKQNTGADLVDNIHVDTVLINLGYYLMYMPVYFFGYEFEGKVYKYFINGQTGDGYGERPYGLGSLGRGLKKIGDFTKNLIHDIKNKKVVDEWKDLQKSTK